MALPITHQAKYWGIAAAAFLVLVWLMGDVLVPFLVGGAIAYFLDPVADRLERLGMSRATATAVITLLMFLVVVLLVLAVIPTLIQQTAALVNSAPDIARNLQTFLTERFPDLTDETSIMRTTLADIGAFIQSKGADLAQGVVSSAMSILSAVIFIVVVP
ncbi:MAG: AI-2E family transporter, partial [Paracoccaceae bacterium]